MHIARSSALLCAAALAVGSAASPTRADVIDVYVFDFDVSIFPPDQGPIVHPTIFVGDTIRWVWLHDFHNVVACVNQDEFWESDVFEAGATFVHTFTIPGVYQYYCGPHGHDNFDGTYEGMGGSITVLQVPSPACAALLGLASVLSALRRRR